MVYRMIFNQTAYFGRGAIKEIPGVAKSHGFTKAFIVTDPVLLETGTAKKVTDVLDEAGMPYEVFSNVKPNPPVECIQDGVAKFAASGADFLIGLGGGSPQDTCKGIGIITANPEFSDVLSLEGVADTKNPSVPIFGVPTTAGTASETTINYVVTDTANKRKFVAVDPHDIPIVAFVDPDLNDSMPRGLKVATGLDALTHAIEAYVSTLHTVFTDPLALKAIHIVEKDLLRSFNGDMGCREEMHYGQCLAGMAFSNALLGIVHSMAHKTGAAFSTGHITHGLANAMYLPYVIAYNAKADGVAERYADIARTMGVVGDTTAELVEGLRAKIRSMNDAMGIPNTLKDFGIIEDEFKEKLDAIAANAVGDACTGSNPRPIDPATMAKLFTCIYYGTEVDF